MQIKRSSKLFLPSVVILHAIECKPLEATMTSQTLRIKRRTNGTIDIDHYRGRALMERKAVMAASLRGAASRATQAGATGVRLAAR
jgi:hypothetical protein